MYKLYLEPIRRTFCRRANKTPTRIWQAAACAVLLVLFTGEGALAQWHIHYYKEKRPLPLDVSQVAILQLDGREVPR